MIWLQTTEKVILALQTALYCARYGSNAAITVCHFPVSRPGFPQAGVASEVASAEAAGVAAGEGVTEDARGEAKVTVTA